MGAPCPARHRCRCFLHTLLPRGVPDPLGRFAIRHRTGPENVRTGHGLARRGDVPEAEPLLRETRLHPRSPRHAAERFRERYGGGTLVLPGGRDGLQMGLRT